MVSCIVPRFIFLNEHEHCLLSFFPPPITILVLDNEISNNLATLNFCITLQYLVILHFRFRPSKQYGELFFYILCYIHVIIWSVKISQTHLQEHWCPTLEPHSPYLCDCHRGPITVTIRQPRKATCLEGMRGKKLFAVLFKQKRVRYNWCWTLILL